MRSTRRGGSRRRALLVLIVAGVGAAASHAQLVSNANTGATYPSIQSAVAAASDGHTLLLFPGTYTESGITIARSLTLRGQGTSNTIVQAAADSLSATVGVFRIVGGASSLESLTIRHGRADFGGGVHQQAGFVTLLGCAVTGNYARGNGGGIQGGTLVRCLLAGNRAAAGGGAAAFSTLVNCEVTGNWADSTGGGLYLGAADGCAISRNSSSIGGGSREAALTNCTLAGNIADLGGGACSGVVANCILWANRAPRSPNWEGASNAITYSCIAPDPGGTGNIAADPGLASATHLGSMSPCIGQGAPRAAGADIDGEPWAATPSMGCDEVHAGAVTGRLDVAISAAFTNVVAGFDLELAALIGGRTSEGEWDFGDGVTTTRAPVVRHAWTSAGTYPVILTGRNETHPGGVAATAVVHVVDQPVHFVDASSATPAPPYTNSATAAVTIQEAVDAVTVAGALVRVADGTYDSGGRPAPGRSLTNRVCILMPMVVRSVHGAEAAVIVGGAPHGHNAVRCAFLAEGARLEGFGLVAGRTLVTGDTAYEQSGGGAFCERDAHVVSCVLASNSAAWVGGGSYRGTATRCAIKANIAVKGGGAYGAVLSQCTLSGNQTLADGGGAYDCTLDACAVWGNRATSGGGIGGSIARNSTLTGNGASSSGGGSAGSVLENCVVYFNRAPGNPNWQGAPGAIRYSCTTPDPGGEGNLAVDPLLAGISHLSFGSPCAGQGTPRTLPGLDIDGETWSDPPSMGCDEFVSGSVTGTLGVAIGVGYTNGTEGVELCFTNLVEGRTTGSQWTFGDDTTIDNRPFVSHTWTNVGTYTVTLTAFNETHPAGIATSIVITVGTRIPVVWHVWPDSPADGPGLEWSNACHTIQQAVDAAGVGDIVLVTNGVYATGARPAVSWGVSNRVVILRPLTLRSVNGPEATIIAGHGPKGFDAIRCIHAGDDGVVVDGFTLTNGCTHHTGFESSSQLSGGGFWGSPGALIRGSRILDCAAHFGGGLFSGTASNCVLRGNSAFQGGGSLAGTLLDCAVSSNVAVDAGGGSMDGTLIGCTLEGNLASVGGGRSGAG